MNIFLFGVLGSILVYLIIGVLVGRSVKNISDYYVTGRDSSTLMISGTLFASMLSVTGFMGDQGFCYSGNITNLVLLNAFCGAGYVFGPLIFGRFLRRSKCETMPEYFGKRFNDFRNRRVSGIITVISMTAYLLSCMTGVAILMAEMTGWSYELWLFLGWLCFTGFTFYSGSKGDVVTDAMMCIVFLVAALVSAPYIFNAQGGLGELLTNLMNNPATPEGLLDYHGNLAGVNASDNFTATMYGVITGLMWMITVSVSPWQAGRNMMARSEHVVLRSGAIAATLTTVYLLFLNLQSIAVINIYPNMEDPQRVLVWASLNVLPKLVGTLLLAGIMAAGLSSASTFLAVMGFSVTSDIVPVEFKSEKQQLRVSRIVMLVVGVIALILAYIGLGSMRVIAYFASTIIASSWAVPAIGGILTKKLSATGARWSMIAGFLGYIVPKFATAVEPFDTIFVNFLDPFFVGLYISLIFAIIGSKLHPATQEEMDYRDGLFVIPKEEKVLKDYRRDKVYGYIMIVSGVAVTVFLLFGWALPYNGFI